MTNILTKPYTDKNYADFAVIANSNGQRIEISENAAYALFDYEELQNGQIIDVSLTEEYKAKILAEENAVKKAQLQIQLDELDEKSIRAMREPSVKDESTGQTWLEFYNYQIQDLRVQLAALA